MSVRVGFLPRFFLSGGFIFRWCFLASLIASKLYAEAAAFTSYSLAVAFWAYCSFLSAAFLTLFLLTLKGRASFLIRSIMVAAGFSSAEKSSLK